MIINVSHRDIYYKQNNMKSKNEQKQNVPCSKNIKLMITTEQFTRLIDQVITEQQIGNNKK